MKNLTSEMIEKAKTAKSTDELLELAKNINERIKNPSRGQCSC